MLLKFCEHTVYVTQLHNKVSRCWQIKLTVCVPCLVGFRVCISNRPARQRVEAVLRRGVRSGLYLSQQTVNGIVDSADDELFELVLQSGDRHVLHELLNRPS